MISTDQISNKICQSLEIKHIEVIDLRGGDHILAIVVSPQFENKTLIEQHKIIYDILSSEINSNEIHALTLKSFSPTRWEKEKNTVSKNVDHPI